MVVSLLSSVEYKFSILDNPYAAVRIFLNLTGIKMIQIGLIVAGSLLIAFLGRNRKFGFWGYFFGSLLLTPFVGLVLVLGSDKRTTEVTAS